jgi:transposase
MEEISVIGIDLAKRVFQLCATTGSGAIAWEKRLRRAAFIKFLEDEAPRCVVGMEACGSAHHWARWLAARGFTVKLMAANAVRAYRAGVHKSDRRDARAVAEATSRSQVAAVRVKSEAAQATQALMRVRERRIRQRVQTTNQLRGLLNEFGIVLPKGQAVLLARLSEVMAGAPFAALPALVQELVERLREEIIEQADKVKPCPWLEQGAAEAMLIQAVKADASCRLLMSIPNIGPINAAALSVALEAPGVFARGRAFAAYLRLVPRQQASAESSALHGIGQMRACEMRSYLVLAAQSLLIRANRLKQPPQDRLLIWAGRLLRRKTRNVAVVAVAAKLARIAWAVMAHNQPYRLRSVGAQPV